MAERSFYQIKINKTKDFRPFSVYQFAEAYIHWAAIIVCSFCE